jgi:hypothetical protein
LLECQNENQNETGKVLHSTSTSQSVSQVPWYGHQHVHAFLRSVRESLYVNFTEHHDQISDDVVITSSNAHSEFKYSDRILTEQIYLDYSIDGYST